MKREREGERELAREMAARGRSSTMAALAMLGGYVLYLALIWERIPGRIPTHFDAAGRADGWGGKEALFLESAVCLLVLGTFALAERFPRLWNFPVRVTARNKERLYELGSSLMAWCRVLVTGIFVWTGLCSVHPALPVWPLYALTALLFAVVARVLLAMRAERDRDGERTQRKEEGEKER